MVRMITLNVACEAQIDMNQLAKLARHVPFSCSTAPTLHCRRHAWRETGHSLFKTPSPMISRAFCKRNLLTNPLQTHYNSALSRAHELQCKPRLDTLLLRSSLRASRESIPSAWDPSGVPSTVAAPQRRSSSNPRHYHCTAATGEGSLSQPSPTHDSLSGNPPPETKATKQQISTPAAEAAALGSPAGAPRRIPKVMLTNTESGKKEELRPLQEGKVGMYVCGVTVYDFSHIGHARVYVAFDALYRYLQSLGYKVTYVRNFTDVDDKILKRASETGEDPLSLSARFIREFHIDMERLGCLPPSVEPKVSEHIPDIVAMIQQIVDRGSAYAVEGGDVFFSVDSAGGYGVLSGRKVEENRAGERVQVDPRKRNPADFALWKAGKEGEGLAWDSPWGRGRPGWHIECSAMSARYLGFQFDIHGGGQDLVFPHHENELAQSKAACPDCHVSKWMHNGFVNIDSEKMSKSLGNFFTIREVLERYHPMALRWFLLNTHYRSPINFSQRQLATASDRLFYVYQALSSCHRAFSQDQQGQEQSSNGASTVTQSPKAQGSKAKTAKPSKAAQAAAKAVEKEAWEALADDLHSGRALASLSEGLKLMGELANPKKKKAPIDTVSLRELYSSVAPVLQVLGFPIQPHECSTILTELGEYALKRAGLTEDLLNARLEERAKAREAKDFAKSDAIRDELAKLGVLLMDGPTGQAWCPSALDALTDEEDKVDSLPIEEAPKVAV